MPIWAKPPPEGANADPIGYYSEVHHRTTMDFYDDDDSTNWAWEQRCYELEIQGIDPDSLDEYDDDDDSEALTAAERNPSMLR